MSLVLIEGLDRTGKSTAAAYFETLGFERVHLSAPPKGTTADEYLQQMVDIISRASNQDIVLDRTHYGELVWPQVYNRKALLDEEGIDIIREIEDSVGVQRLWFTDDDLKGHWQRCVDNKEPLDKPQFTRARALFSSVAQKYGFEKVTLQTFIKQFPDTQSIVDKQKSEDLEIKTLPAPVTQTVTTVSSATPSNKSPEQSKLEVANVINDILSKRILKGKGNVYDGLENELRNFLNNRLGKLLGGGSSEMSLSPEEVMFYKTMYKKATKGD